ncbi:MAG: hypothetical protein RL331_1212 [Bacteroidota bacterium]|jgi:hypothetical protein
MRLFYYLIFSLLLTDVCAQLPDFSATLEQGQLPVVASELATLVANQVLTSQDAQQLLLFFEQGGSVQNLFQLQGLLQSDLSSLVNSCAFMFAPLPKPKNAHFSWSTTDLRYELQFNSPQFLKEGAGFTLLRDTTHLGPAFACQQRLALTHQNWRFAAQLSKDAGELIWQHKPGVGIDFMTAYVAWDAPNSKIVLQKIVAGAYQVQWGQGLQLWSSRGLGKSIDLLQLAKNPLGIKPYQGRDEQRFLQGIAGSLRLADHEILYLASFKHTDFRPTLDTLQEEINFSYTSGLHRTPTEIAKRKQGQEQLYGIGMRRKTNMWQYGALLLYQQLRARPAPDSMVVNSLPKTLSFWSVGAYAQATWRQFYFYTEWTTSLSKETRFYSASAFNVAFVYYLARQLEFGLHVRNYGPYYQAFYANPIGNTTKGANERGCIFQLKWQAQKALVVKLSMEYIEVPHLLNAQQLPKQTNETRILFQYQASKKRNFTGQLSWRNSALQAAQLRSLLAIQIKISDSETIQASAQLSTIISSNNSSKNLELSWQHAPLSSIFRFEFIYGLYQVPPNAPLLYSYPYLLGFGSQTMLLSGIGSYLNGAVKIAFASDWQVGFMFGLKQMLTPSKQQKIQCGLRLLKQF